jgi:vacuolar protein sorting-associated protein 13A/C
LSFDKDFQNRRQKQAETKQTFVKNVGQNLVMGFVSGIAGVVEKPLEGARTGGAVGMFSGIGKGLLGVVTKPTAGILSYSSVGLT